MDLGIKDQGFVVIGGTGGIGGGCALQILQEGGRVVLTGRTEEKVGKKVAELEKEHPGRVAGAAVDLADQASSERALDSCMARFGTLAGVLVSGGGPPVGDVSTVSLDAWRQAFESVFLGPLSVARSAATRMDGKGCIGVVLSSSVYSPIAHLGVSNGLRPGLAMALKSLSDELGPLGTRLVGLVPGRISTERTMAVDAADPEASKRRNATIPLGRLGTVEEIARVAVFMLSPAASYVHGCMVVVDGGILRVI